MSLEELALVAEILGGIGVVASLLYLAYEVRKQSKLNRLNAASELAGQWSNLMASIHDAPDLSAIWLRGVADFDALSAVEKLRFSSYFGRLMKITESLYSQSIDKTLDQMTWRGFERAIRDLIVLPGSQKWWKTRQHWYNDDFQAFVAGLIAEGNAKSLFETYEVEGKLSTGVEPNC